MSTSGSKLSIFAAIAANMLIAIMKFIASVFTGSSAMLSEGIHSLIDTLNGMLLLYGIKQSKQGPTKQHPFGSGKEVYFWSFIVSILIFSLGGGLAIYEGVHTIISGVEVVEHSNMVWNYGVLIGAILFEGLSLYIALKEFRKVHPVGFKSALEESKDAASVAVVIENAAAVVGLVIALIGVSLSYLLQNPIYDALSSIFIGLLLVYVAYFMANETKHLLIGESVSGDEIIEIKNLLNSYSEIEYYGNIRTMHLGPEEVILGIQVNFKDDLKVSDIENLVNEIKIKIRNMSIKYSHIYLESDSINKSTLN